MASLPSMNVLRLLHVMPSESLAAYCSAPPGSGGTVAPVLGPRYLQLDCPQELSAERELQHRRPSAPRPFQTRFGISRNPATIVAPDRQHHR